MNKLLGCACVLAAACVSVLADTAVAEPPRLVLEQRGDHTDVWVEAPLADGATERRRLRQTDATVRPGATGRDPAGRAAFVTWTEGAQRWSAYSRNAGQTWSAARHSTEELKLLDGATAPGAPLPAAPQDYRLPLNARVFLVQFRTVSLPEWRLALEEAGAEVLQFFPLQAHLVRMSPAVAARVRALDFVQRVEPYEPWYRLEPALRDWLQEDAAREPVERRLNVMAFEWGPAGKNRIAREAERIGARVAANNPEGYILELWLDRVQLRHLAADDDVMWVDRWSAPEHDMDIVRQDSGADWVESQDGSCGQGVRGEVLDAGCDVNHQDFDGIITHGPNSIGFLDFSHGTSSFGVVFGNGNRDGDGNGSATGHMPCAGQGICADNDFLSNRFTHTQELKQAPYFASFQTNSWGNSRTTAYTSISSQMDDIIWQLDIAITQSQSNAGNQNSRPQAWAKNIVAVGGINHFNTLDPSDDSWSGASIGPAADGRIKPDIHYWYESILTTANNNNYTNFGGTSAATPTAAGVLGLMVQMWSDNVWNTNPVGSTVFERQPHFGTIKALVVNNAKQYPFSGSTHNLTRTHQGWGRPNAQLARERAASSFIVDQDQPLKVGESVLYLVDVAPGETELKITMVYPDPPGTTSASLHRINDLNLTVFSPSLATYYGNYGLDVGTHSSLGGAPNGVDTVENVFLMNPEPGTWSIEISAPEINQDAHTETPEADAVFALVVTGASASTGVSTPGEAAPTTGQMLVTGYDKATDVVSLTYTPACAATDHVIEFGPLTRADIAAYNWTGQECGVGTSGAYDWDTGGSGSVFFVMVGQTLDVEGSYGQDDEGDERPEDSGATCPKPQDLANSCD